MKCTIGDLDKPLFIDVRSLSSSNDEFDHTQKCERCLLVVAIVWNNNFIRTLDKFWCLGIQLYNESRPNLFSAPAASLSLSSASNSTPGNTHYIYIYINRCIMMIDIISLLILSSSITMFPYAYDFVAESQTSYSKRTVYWIQPHFVHGIDLYRVNNKNERDHIYGKNGQLYKKIQL